MNYYNYNQSRYKSVIFARVFEGAVGNIIIANVVIYLIMVIFQAQNFLPLILDWYLRRPEKGLYLAIIYLYVHSCGFGHIFGICLCCGCLAWKSRILGQTRIL